MMYYFKVGGPLMWILFILSLISTTVIIERLFFFFKKEKTMNRNFRKEVILAVSNRDMCRIIEICDKERNSVGCTVKKFLCRCNICDTNLKDFHQFDQIIKEIEMDEISPLEKRLHILGIIAHVAPMLGLLGTVTGMIKAFQAVSIHGTGDASVLAKGISEALFTTAGGLFVAIPATIFYNYFNKKIDETINDMEKTSTELINYFRR